MYACIHMHLLGTQDVPDFRLTTTRDLITSGYDSPSIIMVSQRGSCKDYCDFDTGPVWASISVLTEGI